MAKDWYFYISGPVGSASSYQLAFAFPECFGRGRPCVIYAEPGGVSQPLLTSNLSVYIGAGTVAGFTDPIPNPFGVGYKPYLYVRD